MKRSDYADIKIFYRIFPLDEPCWDYVKIEDKRTVFIRRLQELNDPAKADLEPHFWEFNTDGVFYNTTQEQVYSAVTEDLLEDLTKGHNATIAAYGQTGSGKSLTLAGLQFSSKDLGIAPRVAQDLFELKQKLPPHVKMAVQISYVEFDDFCAVDLLLKHPNEMDHWQVREKTTKLKVRSKYEALKMMFLGEARKKFADKEGYMSHLCSSVLTFHVTTKNEEASRLHIIDMAGVDTVGNLASIFKKSNEIGRANVTKSDFAQLFLYLGEQHQNQVNIKERNNPLVYFLGEDLRATNMLRFGTLLKGIPPQRKKIETKEDPLVKMKQLDLKLEQLQKDRMLNSILMNQDLSVLNQERVEHLQNTVQRYLSNALSDIDVMNVTEVGMVFKMFKDLYHEAESWRQSSLNSLMSAKSKRGSKGSMKGYAHKKSSKLKVKESIPEGRESFQATDKRHSSTYSGKMENELSNMSLKNATDKNDMSPKTSSTHKDCKTSKSGAGGSFPHMGKKKSRSLVYGKQSSQATLESLSMQPVPDFLPENEEAWLEYRRQSIYKSLQTEYQMNEVNIKEAYNRYQSTLMRNFNCSTHVDPQTANLLDTTEAICKETLNNAERELALQQEMVLKSQSELKIYLSNRKELKAQINDGFESFSKAIYNIPLVPPSEIAESDLRRQENRRESRRESRRASRRASRLSDSAKESRSLTKIETRLSQYKKMLEVEKQRNSTASRKSKTSWK
nr:unnamed protein product [Callosobruchus analis]